MIISSMNETLSPWIQGFIHGWKIIWWIFAAIRGWAPPPMEHLIHRLSLDPWMTPFDPWMEDIHGS